MQSKNWFETLNTIGKSKVYNQLPNKMMSLELKLLIIWSKTLKIIQGWDKMWIMWKQYSLNLLSICKI